MLGHVQETHSAHQSENIRDNKKRDTEAQEANARHSLKLSEIDEADHLSERRPELRSLMGNPTMVVEARRNDMYKVNLTTSTSTSGVFGRMVSQLGDAGCGWWWLSKVRWAGTGMFRYRGS
jgi:hypothetical protein